MPSMTTGNFPRGLANLSEPSNKSVEGEALWKRRAGRASRSGRSRSSSYSGLISDSGGCWSHDCSLGAHRRDGSCSGRGYRLGRNGCSISTTADSEVNARLVGLINGSGVPPPLNDTVASSGTLAAEITWNGDDKVLVVRCHSCGCRSIIRKGDEGLPNNAIEFGIHNRDIGDASVGSADINNNGDDLSCGEGLDIGLVVFELVAFAQVDIASRSIEIALAVGDLLNSLNISVVVGSLIVEHLLATSSLHGITRHTSVGTRDEAMADNRGDEASKGSNEGIDRLHFD